MLALRCGIFLSFSWEKLFLGETRVWLCAGCSTMYLYLNLYFQVFLVVKHVCDCVQQPAPRLWLVSQALSSLRLGSGRQAGAPLTTTHPAKGAAKQFYFLATANFYQSRIIGKYPRSGCPPSLRQTSDKIKFIKFLRHAAFYCLS